jgi:uncharacterized phage infection (PIP) family protein YhgE
LVFPKIPPGIVDRRKTPRDPEILRRRDVVGDLAFTISQSRRDTEGSNNKVFETGQILEFSDGPLKTLDPMLVSPKTETQHDVTRINYEPLGVDEDDQQLISDASLLTHKNLADQLNLVRQQRKNAEEVVVANQKIINDSNRTINALKVIQDQSPTTDSDVDELIQKLEQKKDDAFTARDQATEAANALAAEATRLQNELRTVSTVLT